MSSANGAIVDSLARIAEVYRSQGVVYKYKAYRNAIDTIKTFPHPIMSSDQLRGAKGIGKAMLEKIDELLKTGHLQQADDVAADPVNAALKLFTSVHGIGPVLARQLVDQGHRTLEDLQTAHLPAAVRIGLQHYAESQERLSFDEVEEILTHIRTVLHDKVDAALIPMVCGSHRRLGPTSGDVDVLLTHPLSHSQAGCKYVYLSRAVEELKAAGYIVDSLAEGTTKYMGYIKLPPTEAGEARKARRLDVRWITYDHFYPAVMYFTGSDMFNVTMRDDAKKLGYTLNEYRLLRQADNVEIPVRSEQELFEVLKRPYVKPVDRSK
jgi:DNA polymerase/3'-5' exonuclease PolX